MYITIGFKILFNFIPCNNSNKKNDYNNAFSRSFQDTFLQLQQKDDSVWWEVQIIIDSAVLPSIIDN